MASPGWLLVLLLPLCGMAITYPPGCKEYLATCLERLPPMLANLRGIPATQLELDTACHAFTTGMNCTDNFTANCLELEKQKWVEYTVAGAKATFHMLCKNAEFRKQYLKHAKCYQMSSVTDGWDNCAKRFISIVQEEMARKNSTEGSRIVELCCAKHGFLKCVHGSARLMCGSTSAQFLTKIAETLASVRVEERYCKFVSHSVCSGLSGLHPRPHSAVLAVLAVLAALATSI